MFVLIPKDVESILKAIDGEPAYMPIFLSAFLGLRRGEALGLKWEDTDMDNGVVFVRRNIVSVKGKPYEKEPKSGHGRAVFHA